MKDLNFFSEYILQKKKSLKKAAAVYAVIAALLLLAAGSYIYTGSIANSIEKNISSMEDYLNSQEIKQKLKEINEVRQKWDILLQYSVQLSASQSGISSIDIVGSGLMDKFNKALPAEIAMKSLDFSIDSVKIKGTASDRLSVAELSHNFSALEIFSEVHVAKISSEAETSDRYDFEAECDLKGAVDQ